VTTTTTRGTDVFKAFGVILLAVLVLAGGAKVFGGNSETAQVPANPRATLSPDPRHTGSPGPDPARVKFEVGLEHQGFVAGVDVHWTAGPKTGKHQLSPADWVAPSKWDWGTTVEDVRSGDPVRLTSAVNHLRLGDPVKLTCIVSVAKGNGTFVPLPNLKGTSNGRLCSYYGTVP
jgi:hypothetical protein